MTDSSSDEGGNKSSVSHVRGSTPGPSSAPLDDTVLQQWPQKKQKTHKNSNASQQKQIQLGQATAALIVKAEKFEQEAEEQSNDMWATFSTHVMVRQPSGMTEMECLNLIGKYRKLSTADQQLLICSGKMCDSGKGMRFRETAHLMDDVLNCSVLEGDGTLGIHKVVHDEVSECFSQCIGSSLIIDL